MAVEADVALLDRQGRARGDADLLVDEVDAGDHLRHRMLDLDAGVHLDEVELAVLVEELDGAGAAILQVLHRLGADIADALAHLDIEGRRGAFLPDLLVTALERAVALAEMDGVALAVAQHLDFDVAGLFEVFLDIDCVVAEGGFRLGSRRLKGVNEVRLGPRHLHAASAAAGGRLDDDGIADLPRRCASPRPRR